MELRNVRAFDAGEDVLEVEGDIDAATTISARGWVSALHEMTALQKQEFVRALLTEANRSEVSPVGRIEINLDIDEPVAVVEPVVPKLGFRASLVRFVTRK